jgi:tetratricopeptide (TPR) repeat protein
MRIIRQQIPAIFIFVLLTLLTAVCAIGQSHEENAASFQKIDELLTQGANQQALEMLDELPEDDLNSAEGLWRNARLQYEMGRLTDKSALKFFKDAEIYARAGIIKDPNNSESYKWLAISLGAQSKYSDTKDQVRQSSEIKESIDKAIELNPDDDISYLVLSRWHYKVSALGVFARTFARLLYGEIPKASIEKAEELLWHAISLHDRISHRYNLYKVYKRMDRREYAKVQLEKALLLPVTFPEEAKELEKAGKKLQNWE